MAFLSPFTVWMLPPQALPTELLHHTPLVSSTIWGSDFNRVWTTHRLQDGFHPARLYHQVNQSILLDNTHHSSQQ
jgi:hypothetical protein